MKSLWILKENKQKIIFSQKIRNNNKDREGLIPSMSSIEKMIYLRFQIK